MLVVGAGQNQYNLYNSLRFRASASAYLSRTPASNGNAQKFTYSVWLKRGVLSVDYLGLFSANTGAGGGDGCYFNSTNSIRFYVAGAIAGDLVTTQVFRDSSAWYHIVVAIDTTQATASNRIKIYVNGNQVTAFSTASYPTQNYNFLSFNTSSYAQRIGQLYTGYFDGYLAEVNFIDGQALPPTAFATVNPTTGVGTPIKYAGTYGTNGFYLPFSDTSALTTSSNVGLGKDFSGNGNYWTTNNISITAGVTYDAMTDVPTNTSPTVANYCTVNPLNAGSGISLSNANLTVTNTATTFTRVYSTIGVSSGKFYWETTNTGASSSLNFGVGIDGNYLANYCGQDASSWAYTASGLLYNNGSSSATTSATNATDVIGIALDCDNGKIWFSVNGTFVGSGNPATGANPSFTGLTGTLFPIYRPYNAACAVNFGQRPFSYTPPSGFKALNTFNLPDSTIVQGNKVMDATLYTGTGALQNIVNAGTFQPDLVWTKSRSSGALFNNLNDSVRGATRTIFSNSTQAEDTTTSIFSAFNTNGFAVGSDVSANQSGQTFVGWQWQAGQGTNTTNTAGSITSTVSVNATAGFSVVTYTGNSTAGATVGHGLGVAPAMIITKTRSTALGNWGVYHASLGATKGLNLNNTIAAATLIQFWNNTAPTSSVFSVGTSNDVNGASTYVAYCWAEIAGFSKFGSYTGNGSADGPFIYTGFRPKFIIIKCTSNVDSWYMLDTSRSTYNATNQRLFANASSAESSGDAMDILSNGFKNRSNTTLNNLNGGTYIYMAFAENPFKNALAR